MALLLLVDHLLGAQGGESLRIPVHHAHATVDVALAVEVDEHLDDALRAHLIHGEGRAIPVAGGTQAAQLFQNDSAVFVCPVPGMLQELVARQVVLLDAFSGQLLHHLGFGGNRCVVGAGHPAGILAFHAGTTHQNVLDGVVEHVAHVEHARHIGWRNNDGVGFATIRFRTEQLVVCPVLIPFTFDLFWVVFTCYFHTYLICFLFLGCKGTKKKRDCNTFMCRIMS